METGLQPCAHRQYSSPRLSVSQIQLGLRNHHKVFHAFVRASWALQIIARGERDTDMLLQLVETSNRDRFLEGAVLHTRLVSFATCAAISANSTVVLVRWLVRCYWEFADGRRSDGFLVSSRRDENPLFFRPWAFVFVHLYSGICREAVHGVNRGSYAPRRCHRRPFLVPLGDTKKRNKEML